MLWFVCVDFFFVCFEFLSRFSRSWSILGRFFSYWPITIRWNLTKFSNLKMVTNKMFVEIRILSIRRQDPISLKKHLCHQPSQVKHLHTRIAHNQSRLNILSSHSIHFVDWCMGIWIGECDLRSLPTQACPFQPSDCTSISWPFVMNKSDCSTFQQPKSPPYSYALTWSKITTSEYQIEKKKPNKCKILRLTISHLASKSDCAPVTNCVYPLWTNIVIS